MWVFSESKGRNQGIKGYDNNFEEQEEKPQLSQWSDKEFEIIYLVSDQQH